MIQNPFDKYRMEFSSDASVFDFFAKPQFLVRVAREGAVLVRGGRGTGKTSLLRYLSFEVQTLEYEKATGSSGLKGFLTFNRALGVYYKLNTPSFALLRGYGLPDDRWELCFAHYFNLVLAQKVWSIFIRLVAGEAVVVDDAIIERLCSAVAELFRIQKPSGLDALAIALKEEQAKVEHFITQMAFSSPPVDFHLTLPGEPIFRLCEQLVETVDGLQGAVFHIMLDEYENLLDYQQRIVNTLVKHTRHPVFFKVAGRHYGFRTNATLNPHERIEENQDYVAVDIEKVLSRNPSDYLSLLREIGRKRLESVPFFAENGLTYISTILDSLTAEDEARLAFRRKKSRRQRDKIQVLLEAQGYTSEHAVQLFCEDNPLLERFHYSLLRRGRPYEEILDAYRAYRHAPNTPEARRYSKTYRKLQPNLLFQLLRDERGGRKRYASFEVLGHLSHGIIRNFIELCQRSFQFALDDYDEGEGERFGVHIEHQTEAVHSLSESLLKRVATDIEVRGQEVQSMLQNLGNFFKILNLEDEAVSKPSRSYFSTSKSELDPNVATLLQHAVMHSFLFERMGWKPNRIEQTRPDDFVFNRLLTPVFIIPYGGFDRTTLTNDEILSIQLGQITSVATRFIKGSSMHVKKHQSKGTLQLDFLDQLFEGNDEDEDGGL